MVKHLLTITAMVFLAVLPGCAKSQTQETDGIRSAITEFASAFRTGDYATVEAHIATNYVHVNSGSTPYDRTQWLGWYEGYAREIKNGDHVFEDYDIQDLTIQRYQDSAYVTGIVIANGTRFEESFSQKIRFTNFWINEEGVWKRAGFHDVASSE